MKEDFQTIFSPHYSIFFKTLFVFLDLKINS